VTNSSFGLNQSQAVTDAYDAAYEAGILNIAAAGNTGGQFVTYPATLDSVMAVSATTMNKTLANFSAYGPQIEVAAPGDNIFTTASNGGYGFTSGTSFSSPYTVGVAALVYALNPPDLNDDGRINDEVRQIIKDTAEDLGAAGFDIFFGYGLFDAEAAASAVAGSCYPDFNGDGSLDILDFVAFQNGFTAGDASADCDGSGTFDILDFVCFQNSFTAGCP
jgi:subtilisin